MLDKNQKLFRAAKNGYLTTVHRMLDRGADFNTAYNIDSNQQYFYTPVCIAARNGHAKIVSTLIAAGALLDAAQPNIAAPLRVAASQGHLDIVKLLLAAGALINAVDQEGFTALMHAVMKNKIEVVDFLLTSKVRVNIADHDGTTALMMAAQHGFTDIITLLSEHKVKVNAKDAKGQTALMYAAHNGMVNAVRLLLAKGADPEATDESGNTAAMHAKNNKHSTVANILTNSFEYRLEKINYQGEIPDKYICSISHAIFNDPITVSSGQTFDRASLIDFFASKGNPNELPCPLTRKMIQINEVFFETSHLIKNALEKFVSRKEAEAALANQQPNDKPETATLPAAIGFFSRPNNNLPAPDHDEVSTRYSPADCV